jgi:hypothetical protein
MSREIKYDLNIQAIEEFLIKIENLDLIKEDIKKYHPDDPRYIQYWREIKKKCIEGFWIPQFGKWRFVPGRLYFYANFCTILDVNEVENTRIKIKPEVRDIEWLRSYMVQIAEGFSGWSEDEKYTSDVLVLPERKEILEIVKKMNPQRYNTLLTPYGELKEYKEQWENITELKDKPLGRQLYWNDASNINEMGSRGGGKDLEENTVVYTEKGPVKIKDVKVGDKIFGANGKLTTITQRRDFSNQLQYKITFADGRTIECGGGHLWTVIKQNGKKQTLELNDIKENYLGYKRTNGSRDVKYFIQQTEAIQYSQKNLPIDPYFLGLWLGDGNSHNPGITTLDKEIVDYITEYSNTMGLHVKPNQNTFKTCPTYNLNIKGGGRFKKNPLKEILRDLNLLFNKHIPEIYKYSSVEQRLELVKGLMDSDGYCDEKHIEFSNKNETLVNDLKSILESLGIKVTKKEKVVNNTIYFLLAIKSPISIFKLGRKQRYWKYIDSNNQYQITYKNKKISKNGIINITPTKVKPSVCIAVDNEDSLFVAGDYIVTHNSYYYSLAVAKHEICFNGLKYYTEDSMVDPPKAEVCIGSGSTSKSSEFASKVESSMNELATNNKFGAWGKLGDEDYVPSPLFKEMKGSLKPNNKENLWRHEYDINSNGTWLKKGSGSYIAHVVYSIQKKDGAESAAGGRYGKLLYEEEGLTELLEEAYNSNKATVSVEGKQFGVQIALGTSGNMETIIPAKKWFLNPLLFDTVSFDDIYEHSGKIGFFLPAFLTARQFKDKDGNTNVKAAVDFYLRRRQKYVDNKDPKGLEGEMMNYPIKPSEMFLSSVGSRLPVPELMDHYRELIMNRNFYEYATPGELIFDPKETSGVKFQPDSGRKMYPITEFPIPRGQSQEGCVVIYEHPIEDRSGNVPPFLYLIGHDPTAKDHTTSEGSLASIFVIKTALDPLKYGYYELVAEYIGRPYEGRDKVNELLEKLAMYYGNTPGMIYFENQVGNTKEYFQKKGKLGLLASQPQRVFNPRGGWTKQITYGYPMSNKLIKDNAIDYLADWLKEQRILGGESEDEKKKYNYQFIKSPRLISEMISYNDHGNFDSVMGFLGCVIGIRERFNQFNQQRKEEESVKTNNIIQQFIQDDFVLSKKYNKQRYEQN